MPMPCGSCMLWAAPITLLMAPPAIRLEMPVGISPPEPFLPMILPTLSIFWIIGRNPAGGIDLGQIKDIVKAKERGAKVVVIDPRHSETAILADEWLAIKPETDLAFLLAMINVIIKEELYDPDFVEKKTIGFQQLDDEIINYPPEWAERSVISRRPQSLESPGKWRQPNPKLFCTGAIMGRSGPNTSTAFRRLALSPRPTPSLEISIARGARFPPDGGIRRASARPSGAGGAKVPKSDGTGIPGQISLGRLRGSNLSCHPGAGPPGGS